MFFNDPAIFDSKSLQYVHEHYQLLFELVNDDMIYIGIYYPQVQKLLTQSADLTMIIVACIFFVNLS